MVKIAFSCLGTHAWYDGKPGSIVNIVKLADEAGIDQFVTTDHVIMTDATHQYPHGRFPMKPDYDAFEPVTLLAAIASVTKTIRLSTGILISPLRPAVLLAKQLATLDALSNGRVDIGLGVGWLKDEFDAAGVPWQGRFDLMVEQVRACRALWGPSPSSFHGKFIQFDNAYSVPKPAQGARLPVLFGFAATPRNIERLAEVADGWIPAPTYEDAPEEFAEAVKAIKHASVARGRDPASLQVRMTVKPQLGADGKPDVKASLAKGRRFVDAGATILEFRLRQYAGGPDEVVPFFEAIAKWKP